MNRHFTDAMILELRQDYGDPCSECGEDTRCFGCANALATADELAANLVEIEQLRRDILRYGDHLDGCIVGQEKPCDCGFQKFNKRVPKKDTAPSKSMQKRLNVQRGLQMTDGGVLTKSSQEFLDSPEVQRQIKQLLPTKDSDDVGEAMAREYIEAETEYMRNRESVTEKISESDS